MQVTELAAQQAAVSEVLRAAPRTICSRLSLDRCQRDAALPRVGCLRHARGERFRTIATRYTLGQPNLPAKVPTSAFRWWSPYTSRQSAFSGHMSILKNQWMNDRTRMRTVGGVQGAVRTLWLLSQGKSLSSPETQHRYLRPIERGEPHAYVAVQPGISRFVTITGVPKTT